MKKNYNNIFCRQKVRLEMNRIGTKKTKKKKKIINRAILSVRLLDGREGSQCDVSER